MTRIKTCGLQEKRRLTNNIARLLLPFACQLAYREVLQYPWVTNAHILADEIANDACIIALDGLRRFKNPSAFLSWVETIVRRQTSSSVRQLPKDVLTNEFTLPPHRDEPIVDTVVFQLHQAVRLLPHDLQRAVILRYWQGYTIAKCAAEIGVIEPTVTSRLRRAHERLYVSLARGGYTKREE